MLSAVSVYWRAERKEGSSRALLTDWTSSRYFSRLTLWEESWSRPRAPWDPTAPLKLKAAVFFRNLPPNRSSWRRRGEERARAWRAPPTEGKRPWRTSTRWDRNEVGSATTGRRFVRDCRRAIQEAGDLPEEDSKTRGWAGPEKSRDRARRRWDRQSARPEPEREETTRGDERREEGVNENEGGGTTMRRFQ